MEKSSETFGVLGGWFIDGSTARLLSLSWTLLFVQRWCAGRWFLLVYFRFLGRVDYFVDVVWDV